MDAPNSVSFDVVILTLSEVEWGRTSCLFFSATHSPCRNSALAAPHLEKQTKITSSIWRQPTTMRLHTTPRCFYAALLLPLAATAQSPQKPDAATAAWWAQTTALSNDTMQGRDTGTEAYERAAKYVADQFKAAGLKPVGDNGTFFQRVPMHQIALIEEKSSVDILNTAGKAVTLHFPTDITTVPREQPSLIEAPMIFLGYGMPPADLDLKGKIAVFFNNTPADLAPADRETYTSRRLRALAPAGVAAIISIDNPAAIEPFHWPAASARSVTLPGTAAPNPAAPIVIRINPASLDALFAASGHSSADI